MKNRLLILLVIIPMAIASVGLAQADTRREYIEMAINTYGKQTISDFIRQKRNNHITLWVDDKVKEFSGPPEIRYVTPATISVDIRKIGIPVEMFDYALQEYIVRKESVRVRQVYFDSAFAKDLQIVGQDYDSVSQKDFNQSTGPLEPSQQGYWKIMNDRLVPLIEQGVGNCRAASLSIYESDPVAAFWYFKSARQNFMETQEMFSLMSPPESFREIHNHIEEATGSYFFQGVEFWLAGLKARDMKSIVKGTNLIIHGDRELFQAHEKLKHSAEQTIRKSSAGSDGIAEAGPNKFRSGGQVPGIGSIRLGDSRRAVKHKLDNSRTIRKLSPPSPQSSIELLGQSFNIDLTFDLEDKLSNIHLMTIFHCSFTGIMDKSCYGHISAYMKKIIAGYSSKYGEPTYQTDGKISNLFSPLTYYSEQISNQILAKWVLENETEIVMDTRSLATDVGPNDQLIYYHIRVRHPDKVHGSEKNMKVEKSEEHASTLKDLI